MSRVLAMLFALILSCIFAAGAPAVPAEDAAILQKRTTHTGRGTWFNVGLGNCGKTSKDSDPVVAIAKSRYDRESAGNCGQWIEITNKKNGKVAYGVTLDSCPGCGDNDLDLSPSLFKQLDSLDVGVLDISWHFLKK